MNDIEKFLPQPSAQSWKSVGIKLSMEQYKILSNYAEQHGTSMTQVIIAALRAAGVLPSTDRKDTPR